MITWLQLCSYIHADNIIAGWWKLDEDDKIVPRNIGELLCLVHSEVSEAYGGLAGDEMDDHLPTRPMVEVELADTAIRVCDILGYYKHSPEVEVGYCGPCDIPQWILRMHSCISRSMEHFRKGRTVEGCKELSFLLGLVQTCADQFGYDLFGAIAAKRAYNKQRADHKPEARAAEGGKAF
jgi:hypothetical protein